MNPSHKIITVLGLGVVLTVVFTLKAISSHLSLYRSTVEDEWFYGKASARWTITEYADLECPYCRVYTPQLKQWVSEQDNVKLAWHHFPLDTHGAAAVSEARLVQCAGTLGGASAFWQAIDQVLLRSRSNGQGLAGGLKLPGVSAEDLSHCARTEVIRAAVDRQLAQAKSRGIAATPTIEVTDSLTGHSIRMEGPVDSVALLSVIDDLAAQAPLRKGLSR
ncbi:DsbA family protein [Pseudomonas sp. NyZ201]|uniref:DsbA family protein n=1 Tax=Pseudomonas sp. NyZ201 TaxID=3409857 RepID=UPI003CE8A25F